MEVGVLGVIENSSGASSDAVGVGGSSVMGWVFSLSMVASVI